MVFIADDIVLLQISVWCLYAYVESHCHYEGAYIFVCIFSTFLSYFQALNFMYLNFQVPNVHFLTDALSNICCATSVPTITYTLEILLFKIGFNFLAGTSAAWTSLYSLIN